jgi:predicted MFS family arabinose efflux permease
VVNGTAQGFVFPATSALAFDRAPPGRRNQALAIYNIANLLGATLGASGFGWLAQNLGYRPGFVLASFVLAPGVLLFWRQR